MRATADGPHKSREPFALDGLRRPIRHANDSLTLPIPTLTASNCLQPEARADPDLSTETDESQMDPGASAPSDQPPEQPPENSPPDHPLPDNLGHATATRRRDRAQFEGVAGLRAVRGRNRSDSVPGPASRLAIAVILTPALATRDRAGDASNLAAVNDRVRTTDRCLLGLASQDCEEPVNSLALIDGQGAVGLGEEGHRAPVAGPTAHILAERTRHPHNRQRPGMGDNSRILLLGVGLAAYEQDARLSQVVSDLVHSGKPRVT